LGDHESAEAAERSEGAFSDRLGRAEAGLGALTCRHQSYLTGLALAREHLCHRVGAQGAIDGLRCSEDFLARAEEVIALMDRNDLANGEESIGDGSRATH
jgi:hypothetical protein